MVARKPRRGLSRKGKIAVTAGTVAAVGLGAGVVGPKIAQRFRARNAEKIQQVLAINKADSLAIKNVFPSFKGQDFKIISDLSKKHNVSVIRTLRALQNDNVWSIKNRLVHEKDPLERKRFERIIAIWEDGIINYGQAFDSLRAKIKKDGFAGAFKKLRKLRSIERKMEKEKAAKSIKDARKKGQKKRRKR